MARIKKLFATCEKVADQYGNVVGLFLSLVLVAKEMTRSNRG